MIKGIVYQGGKGLIGNKLLDVMLCEKFGAKRFYDLFGGGGNMSVYALQRGLEVYYNEIKSDLKDLLKLAITKGIPKEWGDKWITKEEFNKLKCESGVFAEMVRCCWSFGNKGRSYLYGRGVVEYKKCLHKVIRFNNRESLEWLAEYTGGLDILEFYELFKGLPPNERRRIWGKRWGFKGFGCLQHLQHLRHLEHLERLERLGHSRDRISFTSLDYRDVKIAPPYDDVVVYCDPPYLGTTTYAGVKNFNHDEFIEWCLSRPFSVFVSEYTHYKGFEKLCEIKKPVLMSRGGIKSYKQELLLWNGK